MSSPSHLRRVVSCLSPSRSKSYHSRGSLGWQGGRQGGLFRQNKSRISSCAEPRGPRQGKERGETALDFPPLHFHLVTQRAWQVCPRATVRSERMHTPVAVATTKSSRPPAASRTTKAGCVALRCSPPNKNPTHRRCCQQNVHTKVDHPKGTACRWTRQHGMGP